MNNYKIVAYSFSEFLEKLEAFLSSDKAFKESTPITMIYTNSIRGTYTLVVLDYYKENFEDEI